MLARIRTWFDDRLVVMKEASRISREQLVILTILALIIAAGGLYAARQSRLVPVVEEKRPVPKQAPAKKKARLPKKIFVHVAGQVASPGLYQIEDGARVADAVKKAGGQIGEGGLDDLNLAARVRDGEKVYVGPRPAAGPVGVAEAGSSDGPIDINGADQEALETLDGIGPVLAQRIIAWRDKNGGFDRVDQLAHVAGIGPKKFGSLKEQVVVY